MIYADEMFYAEKYLLGRRPVIRTGFDFYARQAGQIIDRYTFGRVCDLYEIPDEVRMCCCELAEASFRMEKREKLSGGKTSEKVGTWSASYASGTEQREEEQAAQKQIVYKWLEHTGLCYRGV